MNINKGLTLVRLPRNSVGQGTIDPVKSERIGVMEQDAPDVRMVEVLKMELMLPL